MPPAKLTGPCVLEGQGPCRTGSRAFRRLTTFAFHKIHPAVREQHPGVALDAVLCHGHYMRFVEAGRGGNSRPYWERERIRVLEEQWQHVRTFGESAVCSGSASSRDSRGEVSPSTLDTRRCLQQPSHESMTSPAPQHFDASPAILAKHHVYPPPERSVRFGPFADDVEMSRISVTYNVDKPQHRPCDVLQSSKTPVPAGAPRQDHVQPDFVRRPRGRPRTAINTYSHRGFDPQLFVHEANAGADVSRGKKEGCTGVETKATSLCGRKGTDRPRTKRDLQWADSVPSEPSAEPAVNSCAHEDCCAALRTAPCSRPTTVPNYHPSAPGQNHKNAVTSALSDDGPSPAIRGTGEAHRRFGLDVEDNVNSALLLMFLASRARRGEWRAAADASTGGPRKVLDCAASASDGMPRRNRETGETDERHPRGRQRYPEPADTASSPPATTISASRAHHQAGRAGATNLPSIRELFPGIHEWGVFTRPLGSPELENPANGRLGDLHGCTGEGLLSFVQ